MVDFLIKDIDDELWSSFKRTVTRADESLNDTIKQMLKNRVLEHAKGDKNE